MTRGWRRRVLAAFALAACAWLPGEARAEGPRVLFIAPGATPFSTRVRAEIEGMGFSVELAAVLLAEGTPTAVAAARVIEFPPPRRIELWTADPSRGGLVLRAVIESLAEGDEATESVEASEQLRAYFQPLRELPARDLGGKRAAHADEVPLPQPEPPRVAPPARGATFTVTAAIAVPIQPGGPGMDVALRARWMATRVFGVGGLVALPITSSALTSAQGEVRMLAPIIGAELSAVLLDVPRVSLAVSAGIGAAWLHTLPSPPGADFTVTGLPFLGVEIAPRLTARLRLHLAGDVAVSLAKTDVLIGGEKVATWGLPLGLFFGGMSVDF
jgi:hypothetical protein